SRCRTISGANAVEIRPVDSAPGRGNHAAQQPAQDGRTIVNVQNRKKAQVAVMNAVHDLPVLVARDKGLFKDQGLDIEFVTTPGMAQVTTSHVVKFDSIFDRPLDSVYNEGGIDQYRMCEWGIMKRAVEARKEGRRDRKIVALGASMSKFAIVVSRDSK